VIFRLALLWAAATTAIVGLGLVGFCGWSILIGYWIGLITTLAIAYLLDGAIQ
jgi:hypothetical protein